jgi:inhibitor of KinA sporulation pathway (predicted exonuclease)
MDEFEDFLVKNELYDPEEKRNIAKVIWCCDGPWDLKEFYV